MEDVTKKPDKKPFDPTVWPEFTDDHDANLEDCPCCDCYEDAYYTWRDMCSQAFLDSQYHVFTKAICQD
jgi:hypothetical protein